MKPAFIVGMAAVLIAGCSEAGDGSQTDTASTTMIDCSLNGAGGFGRDCTMERADQDSQDFVILRHPDGAFRRFQLGVPGRGLITADGAQQAEVTNMGGYVEVRIGSDRYHLPVSE